MIRIDVVLPVMLVFLLVAAGPTVAIDPEPIARPASNETATPADTDTRRVSTSVDELAVSGYSNRGDGHVVVVELVRPDGTTVRLAVTEVTNSTWNTTLDIAAVPPGSYTLRVTDGDVETSTALEIRVTPTPTETPFETPTAVPTPDDTPTATPTAQTTRPLPSPVPTLAQSPGFGAGTAIVAVVLAVAALGWRRRR